MGRRRGKGTPTAAPKASVTVLAIAFAVLVTATDPAQCGISEGLWWRHKITCVP